MYIYVHMYVNKSGLTRGRDADAGPEMPARGKLNTDGGARVSIPVGGRVLHDLQTYEGLGKAPILHL